MSKLTSIFYKAFTITYNFLPFKKTLCLVIKKLGIPHEKFYRDFKFKAKFKIAVDIDRSFFMFHHGETIENETFWNGLFTTWENEAGWIWKQLSKTSEIVFDIGANTGIYSLITKCINPDASVYAFEPSENIKWKLELNNKINNYHIVCEPLAVSNVSSIQLLYGTHKANETSASLSPDMIKNNQQDDILNEYKVRTTSLADYIEANNIKKIDLMKIDIEMHEPEAIEGFGKYLELFKPVIFIEVLSDKVANKLNKLIGNDFILLHLRSENIVEQMPRFKAIIGEWNYLIFHKDLENHIRQHTTLKW